MKRQIKKTIVILLVVCFLVSMTATAVSARHIPEPIHPSGKAWGEGHNNAGGNPDPGSNAGGNAWGFKLKKCSDCSVEVL